MPKKVVLSYSGGLDTSICIHLLKDRYGYGQVITVAVDVGQSRSEIKEAEKKASKLSDKHYTLDVKEEFVQDYLFPLIKANGDYEGYVLGTAITRPLIAKKVVDIANKEDADALAHGCTGKGNDQLRFDVVFRATNLEVVAPLRDLDKTREWEMEYAIKHDIPVPATKVKPWSIDENIWSRSIEGGMLDDPFYAQPEEIFQWTTAPEKAPDVAEVIEIGFEIGIPISLNGKRMGGISLIQKLNKIGGKHGVGRSDIMEDRVLGLKMRESYENPAATILLKAHRDLEKLVLTRSELKFKAMVDDMWGELAYQGLVDDPLMADLNAFIDKTQERVTGFVKVRLFKGNASVIARRSPNALIFEGSLNQKSAEGYSKFYGLQARIFQKLIKRF